MCNGNADFVINSDHGNYERNVTLTYILNIKHRPFKVTKDMIKGLLFFVLLS